MKTLLPALTLIALAAGIANAATVERIDMTDTFILDITDPANAIMTNISDAGVPICGFTFDDPTGSMIPEAYIPVSERFSDPWIPWQPWEYWFPPNNFLGFAVMGLTPYSIAEGTAGDDAIWPASYGFGLGGFAANCSVDDLQFTIVVNQDGQYVAAEGLVVPEPASMSLLGLGALAMLRRRRR